MIMTTFQQDMMEVDMAEEATRRVLDMLSGWADFSGEDEHGIDAEADKVHDLYQEFGSLENPSMEEISAFIRSKIVPLLLNGVG
jgi:hypothetical protein